MTCIIISSVPNYWPWYLECDSSNPNMESSILWIALYIRMAAKSARPLHLESFAPLNNGTDEMMIHCIAPSLTSRRKLWTFCQRTSSLLLCIVSYYTKASNFGKLEHKKVNGLYTNSLNGLKLTFEKTRKNISLAGFEPWSAWFLTQALLLEPELYPCKKQGSKLGTLLLQGIDKHTWARIALFCMAPPLIELDSISFVLKTRGIKEKA